MLTFTLNSDQEAKIKKWSEYHYEKLHQDTPYTRLHPMLQKQTAHGCLSYEFHPTVVGIVIFAFFCKNTEFEQKLDISEYDNF